MEPVRGRGRVSGRIARAEAGHLARRAAGPGLVCGLGSLSVAMLGFYCGGSEAVPSPRLRVALESPAVTLDPHGHAHNLTAAILAHFYDALVSFDPDLHVQPRLAESWENPSDSVWRLHLRRGVVFHDGRPLGAEDVAASLRRAMRPGCPVAYNLLGVSDVRVVREGVIEIATRFPSLVLLNKLAAVPIVPRDAPERIERPVGTGPYRFVAATPAGAVDGQRFERFWGRSPAFDTVSFVAIPDDDRRAEAVVRDEADVVCQYPRGRWQWGMQQTSMRMRSALGLQVIMVVFSVAEDQPFSDLRLRTAASLAVDRSDLVAEGLGGLGAPLDQLVPPAVHGYAKDLPVLPNDAAAARRLVTEARWPPGAAVPLYTARTYEPVVRVLVRQLADVGIRLEPQILAQGLFYEKLAQERLPAALFGWSAQSGDASATLDPLFHSPSGGFGRFNGFSYANPTIDSLIESADRAARPRDRLASFAEAMRILREDALAIPLAVVSDLYATRAGLEWEPPIHRQIRAEEVRPSQAAGSTE